MKYLNTGCTVICAHGGQVNLTNAGSKSVDDNGNPLLIKETLIGAPITGCAQMGAPGLVPCTVVTSVTAITPPSGLSLSGETFLMPGFTIMTNGSPTNMECSLVQDNLRE